MIVNTIINTIQNNKFELKKLFFLNDSNSTNKIFVQNIVITKLQLQNYIVLTITFFDIAVTFFNNDQTAHVRFKKILILIIKAFATLKQTQINRHLLKRQN